MDVQGMNDALLTREKGQRLYCEKCGSEIEIISPCGCEPGDQVLRCCGQDMAASTGRAVNLGVE